VTIRGTTRIVGIIGDPVTHSRSPVMHNAAFAHLKLDYAYVPLRVNPSDLKAAVAAIRALNLAGVNVTVPHKERVLPLLDSVSEAARCAAAVNTIVNRNGHLFGDNTDGIGFLRALRLGGAKVRGRDVLIVGAGGAARGVAVALVGAGARRIVLANRTLARARRLVGNLMALQGRAPFRTELGAMSLTALADPALVAGVDLVVNATALGLRGETFPALCYAASRPTCLFYDLLYGRETDFLRRARRSGRRTLDGASMLLYQGAAAFSLWTGRRAPLATMAEALGIRGVEVQIDNRQGRR
jgi:shikimate dehydrogenase